MRGRVKPPIEYATHFASHPGHGLEPGESVEVPREKILVAARRKTDANQPIGYDSEGKSVAQLKPTSLSTKVHAVKPGTPYDLVLPYRTERLVWQVKAKDDLVTMIQIGEKGLLEQIKFAESSLRGTFSVVLLNDDPKDGLVFVARSKKSTDTSRTTRDQPGHTDGLDPIGTAPRPRTRAQTRVG